DATSREGWWYEGAGIYRHVWLVKTDPLHITPHGTFVTSEVTKKSAEVTIRTTIVNESDEPDGFNLKSEISNLRSQKSRRMKLAPWAETEIVQAIAIKNPALWSPDTPNLYQLRSTIERNGKRIDAYDTSFGMRTIRWDAKNGFFLNGKPL